MLKAGDRSEVEIIESVAEDWGKLAVALGFDHTTRIAIATESSFEAETACIAMFDQWLEGGENLKPATWNTLMTCLKESNFTDLARKLDDFMLY